MSPEAKARRAELAPTAPADVDLKLLQLCRLLGRHHFEGRVVNLEPSNAPRVALCALGRCQVCGLGVMTDL